MSVNGPYGPATVNWLINRFMTTRAAGVVALANAHLPAQFLTDYFTPLVNDHVPRLVGSVLDLLEELIRFYPDYQVGPFQIKIANLNPSFPAGLDIVHPPIGTVHVDTKWMSITAELLIQAPSSVQARKWQIGFVQTVLSLDRTVVTSRKSDLAVIKRRSWIPGPRKDGPKGYAGIWFDEKPALSVVKRLTEDAFQKVTIQINDRPGMDIDPTHREDVEEIRGGDSFKTWIVLRKIDGTQIEFLRMWEWKVDYTIDWATAPYFGIKLIREQNPADGRDAVLDGLTAKDSIQTVIEEVDQRLFNPMIVGYQ